MIVTTDAPISDPRLMAHFIKANIEGNAEGFARCMRPWGLPPLYQSGVRFVKDPNHGSGKEWFCSPLATYARKGGDCDQLCIYRIAELRAQGIPATCRAIWIGTSFHVQVRRTDGKRQWVEDPSVILGAKVNWPLHHLWDVG